MWALTALCAIYGATHLETNFTMYFFIPEGSDLDKFLNFDLDYYRTGFYADILVVNDEIDYASETAQYTMIDFWDKMKRCYLCDETWWSIYNLSVGWYQPFNKWVGDGNCSRKREGLRKFEKVIPPDMFYDCYFEWVDIRMILPEH